MKSRYYFEYGGGLGDVFMQMYEGASYNVINEMLPDEHAEIVLGCHNPHAAELFAHHPRKRQVMLYNIGYCSPVPEEANPFRRRFGLCRLEERPPNPRQDPSAPILFFPPEKEKALIETVSEEPFIVLSASSGERSRSIPASILREITSILGTQSIRIIAVGRNYARADRFEQSIPESPNLVNMIDKLSVPSVAQLVQRCSGTINGHSAVGMLGWLEKKPQLLLIDEAAWARHFKRKDAWAFGADYETTLWKRFEQFRGYHVRRFIEATGATQKAGVKNKNNKQLTPS